MRNRTLIGIVCIVLALAVTFGVYRLRIIHKKTNPTVTVYKDLVRSLKYRRMRENENEQKRIKRSEEKHQ